MQARSTILDFFLSSLLLISLKPMTAVAEANAMDGSFRYSLDFKNFTLTYNSRSLHEGVFGLGWYASFEKKNPNFQPSIKFNVQNGRLLSLQGGSRNLKFQYDRNSNLSIIHDLSHHKMEMIRYDNQDRVISHHHQNLCFDQFQYRKEAQNLYMTEVTRSCPYKSKEKLRYAFSIKTGRQQQRQISSLEISRYSDEKRTTAKTKRLSTLP